MNKDDQIINNQTLAPLNEANLYQTKSLSDKDSRVLAQIAKTNITNIEQCIGTMTHFLENIKFYKSAMIDAINLQSESADIATKYANQAPKQSYTLPGVITIPASYDISSIKSDNERMEQIKDLINKTTDQKQIYMRILQEDFRLFLSSYKRMCYSDASFDTFIESLNNSISDNY